MVEVPLYYESIGSGEPIVLIHAGIADATMWDDNFGPLAEQHRVIRFDAQGFGRSPAAAEPNTRARDIHDLLQALEVPRAHLVGVSMGGGAAIDFALEYPRMVGCLIPVAAGLSGFQFHDPWMEEEEAHEEAAIQRGDVDAAAEVNLRVWLAGPGRRYEGMNPDLVERVRRMARHALVRSAERARTPQLDPPAVARVNEITAPTLVIVGDHDVQFVQVVADVLAERIRGARKHVFNDAAHMLNMEWPEEFNRSVLDFVAAHPLE